jgi:hypothetical protein
MWQCSYCSFISSRKWNTQVHEKRKHQDQISTFNSDVQRKTWEHPPFQGGQPPLDAVYQQPIHQHPSGGQQVVHGARAQAFYHQPDQVPNQTSTFHGDELKSVEQKQQPVQHHQAGGQQVVHGGQVVHQQPVHHGEVAHQQPVQHGLTPSEEQPMDLDLLEDSIQVVKIFKLLQRMKNK